MAWSPSSSEEDTVRQLLGPRGAPPASSYRLSDLRSQQTATAAATADISASEGERLMSKVHGDQSDVRQAIKNERAKLSSLSRTTSSAPPIPPRRINNVNLSFVSLTSEPGVHPSPRRRPPPPPSQPIKQYADKASDNPVPFSRTRLSRLLDKEQSLRSELSKPSNIRQTYRAPRYNAFEDSDLRRGDASANYASDTNINVVGYGGNNAVRRRVLHTPSKNDSNSNLAPPKQFIANKLIDRDYAVPVSSLSIRNLVQNERAARLSLSQFSDELCDASSIESVVGLVSKFAASPDVISIGLTRMGLWIVQVSDSRGHQELIWSLDSHGVQCEVVPPPDRHDGIDLFNKFFSRQMKADSRDRINLTKCDPQTSGFSESVQVIHEALQISVDETTPEYEALYSCDWNLPYALMTPDRSKDLMGMVIVAFTRNPSYSLLEGADEIMALNILHDITMMISAKLSELQQADEIDRDRAALEHEKNKVAAFNQILDVSSKLEQASTSAGVSKLLVEAVDNFSTLSIISCVVQEQPQRDASDNLKWFSVLPSHLAQKVSVITLDTSSSMFRSLFMDAKSYASAGIVSTLGELSMIGFMPLIQGTSMHPQNRIASMAVPLDYERSSMPQCLFVSIDADMFDQDSLEDLFGLVKHLCKMAASAYHRISLSQSESIRTSVRGVCSDMYGRLKAGTLENPLVRMTEEIEGSGIKEIFGAQSSRMLIADDQLVRSGVTLRHKSGAPIKGRVSEQMNGLSLCSLRKEGNSNPSFELAFDLFETNPSEVRSEWKKSLLKGTSILVNSLYYDSNIFSQEDWLQLKHSLKNVDEDATSYILVPVIRLSASHHGDLIGLFVLCDKTGGTSKGRCAFESRDVDNIIASGLQTELSAVLHYATISSDSSKPDLGDKSISAQGAWDHRVDSAIESFQLDISAAVDAGAASEVDIDRIIALNIGLLFRDDAIDVIASESETSDGLVEVSHIEEAQTRSYSEETKSDIYCTQLRYSIHCRSECLEILRGHHEYFDTYSQSPELTFGKRVTHFAVAVSRTGSNSHFVGFDQVEIDALESLLRFISGYFGALSSHVSKIARTLARRVTPYYELHRFISEGFPLLMNNIYSFDKGVRVDELPFIAKWIKACELASGNTEIRGAHGNLMKYLESPEDCARMPGICKQAIDAVIRETKNENQVHISIRGPNAEESSVLEIATSHASPNELKYIESICILGAYFQSLANQVSNSAGSLKDCESQFEKIKLQTAEITRLLTVEKTLTDNLRKRLSAVLSLFLLFSKASRISTLEELATIFTEALPSVLGASSLAFFVAENVINLCTTSDIQQEAPTFSWSDTHYVTVGLNTSGGSANSQLRAKWRQLQNIPDFSANYSSTQLLIPLYLPQRVNSGDASNLAQDLRFGVDVPFAAMLLIMPERKDADDFNQWSGLEDFLKTSMSNFVTASFERLQNMHESKRACAALTQSFKLDVEGLQEQLKSVIAESEHDLSELSEKCSLLAAEKSDIEESLTRTNIHCNKLEQSLIKFSEISLDEHLDTNSLLWLGKVCSSINAVGAYVCKDKSGHLHFQYIEGQSNPEILDATTMKALQSGLLSFATEAIKMRQVINSTFESDVNFISSKIGQLNSAGPRKLSNFVLCIPADFATASDDNGPVVCCIFTKSSAGLGSGGFEHLEVDLLLSSTAAVSNVAQKFSTELYRVFVELHEHRSLQKYKTGVNDLTARVASAALKLWGQNASGPVELGAGIELAFSKLFSDASSRQTPATVKIVSQVYFHPKAPSVSEDYVDMRRPKQAEMLILRDLFHSGLTKRDGVILWVPINRQLKDHVETVAIVRLEKVPIFNEYAKYDRVIDGTDNLSSRNLSELDFSVDEESSFNSLARLCIPCFDRLNLIRSTYSGVKKASRAIEAMQVAQDEVESKLSLEVATKLKLKDAIKHSSFIMDSVGKNENYPSALHQYETLRKAIIDVLSAQEFFVIAPVSYFDGSRGVNQSVQDSQLLQDVIDPSRTTIGWLQGVYYTMERDMKSPTDVNLNKGDIEYMSLQYKKHITVDGSLDDENWIAKSWCMRSYISSQGRNFRSEDEFDLSNQSKNGQGRSCHMCVTPFYTTDGSLALAVVIKKRVSFTDLDHDCISFLLKASQLSLKVIDRSRELDKVHGSVSDIKSQTVTAISSRDDFVRNQLEALLNGLFIASDSFNDARIIDAATNTAAHYITNEASNKDYDADVHQTHFMDSICSGITAFGEIIFGNSTDVVVEVIKSSEFNQFSRSRAPGLTSPSSAGKFYELSSPGSQLRHYGLESLPLVLSDAGAVSYTSINALYWIYVTRPADSHRLQENGSLGESASAVISLAIHSKAWGQDAVKVTVALKNKQGPDLDSAYHNAEEFQKLATYMLKIKVAVMLRLLAIHGSWMVSSEATVREIVQDLTAKSDILTAEYNFLQITKDEELTRAEKKFETSVVKINDRFKSQLFESNRLCKATENYLRTALMSIAKCINVSITGKLSSQTSKSKTDNPLLLDASILLKTLVQICSDVSSVDSSSCYDICYSRAGSDSSGLTVTWVETDESKKDKHRGVHLNKFKKSLVSEDSPIHIAITMGSYVLISNESKKPDFVQDIDVAHNRSGSLPLIISKSQTYATGTLFIPIPAFGGSKISFVIMMSARQADSTEASGNLISGAPRTTHFSGLMINNLIACWNAIRDVCSALSDQSRAFEKMKSQADGMRINNGISLLDSIMKKRTYSSLQSSFLVWRRSVSVIAAYRARETSFENRLGSYLQKNELLEKSIADWTEAVKSINGIAAGTLTKGLRGFWSEACVSLLSLLNGSLEVTGCGLLVTNHKNEMLDLCARDLSSVAILHEGSQDGDNIVVRPATELGVEVMTLAWNLLTTDGPQRSKRRFWNMSRASPYGAYSEEVVPISDDSSVEEMWLIPVQTAWDVLGILRVSVSMRKGVDFAEHVATHCRQNIINFADVIAPIILAARHMDVSKSRERQLVADMEVTGVQAQTSLHTLRLIASGTKRLLLISDMYCSDLLQELDNLQKSIGEDVYMKDAMSNFLNTICEGMISVLGRDVCVETAQSESLKAASLENNILRAALRSDGASKEDFGSIVVYCERRMSTTTESENKLDGAQYVDAVSSALPILASTIVYCYLNSRSLIEKAIISRNVAISATSNLLTNQELEENNMSLKVTGERNSVISYILEHCSVAPRVVNNYDDFEESESELASGTHASLFKGLIRKVYNCLGVQSCAMRIGTVFRDESRTMLENGQLLLAEDTSLNWVLPKVETNGSPNKLTIQDFNIGEHGIKIAANMASDCVASRSRTVVDITIADNIPIRILTLPIQDTKDHGEILAVLQVLLPSVVFMDDNSLELFFGKVCNALSVVLSNEKMARDLHSQLASLSKVSFDVQEAAEHAEIIADLWKKKCSAWKSISVASEAIVRGVLAHVPLAETLLSDEVINSLKQAHVGLRLLQDNTTDSNTAHGSASRIVLTLSTPISSTTDETIGFLDSSIEITCTGIQSQVSMPNDTFAHEAVEYVAAIIRSAEAVAGRTNILIRDSSSQVSSMISRIGDLQAQISEMERDKDLLSHKNSHILERLKTNLAMQERRNDFVGEILIPTVKGLTEGLRRLIDDSMSPNLPESVARVLAHGKDSKVNVAELKTAYLIDKAYSAIVSHCSRAVVKGQELNRSYETLRALSSGDVGLQTTSANNSDSSPILVSLLVRRERSAKNPSGEAKDVSEKTPKYAMYEGSTGAHSVISDSDVSKAFMAEKSATGKSVIEKCFKHQGLQELTIPLEEIVVGQSVSMIDLLGLDHIALASLLSRHFADRSKVRLHISCVSVRDASLSGGGDKLTARTPAVIRCIWLETVNKNASEATTSAHLVHIPYLLEAIVSSSIGLLRCISEMSVLESKKQEAETDVRSSKNNIAKLNDHLARWRRLYRIVTRESGQLLDPPTVSLTNSLVLPFLATEDGASDNERVEPPGRLAHPAYLSPIGATQDVCLKVLSVCRTLLRSEGQAIFLADVDTSPMSFQVIATGDALTWSGVQAGTIGRVFPAPLNGSLVETTMQSHKPLIIDDLSKDDRYLPQVDGVCLPKTPCIIVPLRGRSGVVIGVLVAARGHGGVTMTSEDVAVAEMLVSMASLSLYWCRGLGAVHVQVEKALDRVVNLEQEVENRIVNNAKK